MSKKSTKKTAKKAAAKKPVKVKTIKTAKPAPAAPVSEFAGLLPKTPETMALAWDRLYGSPLNPRKIWDVDALDPLAASIAKEGLLQPLMARPGKNSKFEIIHGARRHAAIGLAIKAGKLSAAYPIQVRVREATDAELVELAATENMARADMHPLDEADAIEAMRKFYKEDAEIMRRLGMAERSYYRRVALLKLAEPLRKDLRQGKITLQQAAAYSLGTEKTQLEWREKAKHSQHYAEVEHIRDAMTEKRAKVETALFDAQLYTGDILTDHDTGQRYFANLAMFKDLQDEAIKLKVKELKKRWAWVKEEDDEYNADDNYVECAARDKKAGAIWYIDDEGKFQSRAPVKEAEYDDAGDEVRASHKETAAEKAKRLEQVADEKANDKMQIAIFQDLIADPQLAVRVALARKLAAIYYDLSYDDLEAKMATVALKTLLPIIGDIYNAKTIQALAKTLSEDRGEKAQIMAYAALRNLSAEALGTVAAVLFGMDCSSCLIADDKPELSGFGVAVMQRDLPLAEKAAAE